MTDKDKLEIKQAMVEALKEQEHSCPLGIDADTAETMKSFAEAIKLGRKTAYKAFIILAVGALVSALYAGIKELIHK